ncbi:uncharacterized protein LOC112453670, partial [Temnothorax curvispinosus]|uniref:Uncharacterized protein LOC112453670 n=1 Tax=Temnothorax curvispinosus TaxID=300111 RepID=A0A6J1PLV1_9HYME
MEEGEMEIGNSLRKRNLDEMMGEEGEPGSEGEVEKEKEIGWEEVERVLKRLKKEAWKDGVVVSIAKKRGKRGSEHRGITLIPTAYKVYASILANRLREEMVEKGMIPESQAGFRKRRGVVDNIYTLNYAIGKRLKRKKKVMAAFVDPKAAFDSVDRRVLGKCLKKPGVNEKLGKKIMEIYEKTRSVVRMEEIRKEILDSER